MFDHSKPPQTGTLAPDFRLADSTGEPCQLSELVASHPYVLVFYRGHWCPFCLGRLRDFGEAYHEFQAAGTGVLALSVDEPRRSEALRKTLDLPFRILCDPRREVVREWGLLNRSEMGAIARPAVFVVDSELKVIFRSLDCVGLHTRASDLLTVVQAGTAANHQPRRSLALPSLADVVRGVANAGRYGMSSPNR